MYKTKAAYNDGHGRPLPGGADPAAQVRGGRAAAGAAAGAERDDAAARRAHRQAGGRLRAARADRADEAVRPRGLVRRAGRRARLQRVGQVALPAAARGRRHRPRRRAPAGRRRRRSHRSRTPASRGSARGCGPGWFAQTHEHPELVGRTLLDDPAPRRRAPRRACRASRPPRPATATSWRGPREQTFDSLSGGQQARFQILLLELSGATLLLLDEPTDNLDLHSAEALEEGLDAFEGTVAGRDARPLVRPRLRPVPRVRRGRAGLRVGPSRSGTRRRVVRER